MQLRRKATPVLFIALALFAARALWASPELIDRIVAVVDNQVILWSELNYRLRFEMEQRGLSPYAPTAELNRLRDKVLDEMIDEQVLILKAQRDSVQIDQAEVEELLGQQFRMAKRNATESQFAQMLERIGLSERQLKNRYRKEIRHRLLFRQMRAQVSYKLHITRRDIDAFRLAHRDTLPAEISISHINLKMRPSEDIVEAKRTRIEEFQRQLEAGADFADLARTYSEDPGTAARGGDLGCFTSGTLVPEFEEAAFQLKPGEISQPVLTKYGYHLILLHEKREDELCASHILVLASTGEEDRKRVHQSLEELRQRALAGEDFALLARTHSENPQTALRGGLWDLFPKAEIPPYLQPYLDGLQLGGISEPFFLDDGGHILKINNDQATIETLIREERTAQVIEQMIDEYRQLIHVEKRLDQDFLRQPGHGPSGYLSETYRTDQAAQ